MQNASAISSHQLETAESKENLMDFEEFTPKSDLPIVHTDYYNDFGDLFLDDQVPASIAKSEHQQQPADPNISGPTSKA
ncbi:hypothetical protein WR25_12530 [Diploscapter pachys]|uniref:Uncharacterized protein n=1 Tax=Diploscapter pachys TaxID=2018661 RepID=A0A2A2JV03_9BILA|nr:hypothetical protein WR25_12530 [Diploscapter pachys]